MSNGKGMISVNLKSKEGVEIVKKLCASADVLLDPYRPGVMERLGLGPEILTKINERLVYARLTGYRQTGYFKNKAGYDINYVAMSGIFSLFRTGTQPQFPFGSFAGGSLTKQNKKKFEDVFMTKTQEEWSKIFDRCLCDTCDGREQCNQTRLLGIGIEANILQRPARFGCSSTSS